MERLDSLAKPPGSVGKPEDIAIKLSGISGETFNDISKRCVIVMCSDNGVVEEGVASAPQSVTYSQAVNFTRGITGVAVFAKQFNADLIVVEAVKNGFRLIGTGEMDRCKNSRFRHDRECYRKQAAQ